MVVEDGASAGRAAGWKGRAFGIDFESRLILCGHVLAAVVFSRQFEVDASGVAVSGLVFDAQIRQSDLPFDNFEAMFLGDLALLALKLFN
jgi:hypothetical protein